jgi:hypothetical protein
LLVLNQRLSFHLPALAGDYCGEIFEPANYDQNLFPPAAVWSRAHQRRGPPFPVSC